MSKRLTSHRKPKVSAVSDGDSNERHSSRRSSLVSHRLAIDSPNKSPNCVTNRSPNCAKESHNLSQYFPSRKRSQSSPRMQSSLDLKYTRLKSPKQLFLKPLLVDNPIAYGELGNNCSQKVISQEITDQLMETPNEPIVPSVVETDVEVNSRNKKSVDFCGLLCSFKSVMEEVIDEDMEHNSEDFQYSQNESQVTQRLDKTVDGLSQMISKMATEVKNDKQVFTPEVEPIACHSRDVKPIVTSTLKTNTSSEQQISEVLSNCDSIPNQSNSFDDFDDSFDEMLSQMKFEIKSDEICVQIAVPEENNQNNESMDEIHDEDDDGFESDGDFEQIISQIPIEELMNTSDKSDSALDSSVRESMNSSGLITLSQIIDLINQD